MLTDALRSIDGLDPSSLALRLLRALDPELTGLVDAAQSFAVLSPRRSRAPPQRRHGELSLVPTVAQVHVAGADEPPKDAWVAAKCAAALDRFDEAFLRVRMELIFTGESREHPSEAAACMEDVGTAWVAEVVAAEAVLFAATRYGARPSRALEHQPHPRYGPMPTPPQPQVCG